MRYLDRIVFINSASVNYAEIELDGNIHLTGNQGSGKSTLLRAILFFYNANKLKLGIGKEKRRFDDYYFEYQNSYIVYEVKRDTTFYCIVAYKVNGKVAFRFIDSEYKKEFFINQEGKAYESWEKIRAILGKHIHYSRIINNYEECRQIIYGDNKGLKPEFRKYSIIESKQYQNIPRTIQNVFLNTKLEAQFIKETIINSISDEIFTIDLENYAKNHLRDFENQINDVSIWSKKNKKGQIIVRNQAEKVIENYRIYNYIIKEKQLLATHLYNRMQFIKQKQPLLKKSYDDKQEIKDNIKKKLEKIENLFRKREQDIISEIKLFQEKLNEAKEKNADYESKNITEIIEKVKQQENIEQQKNDVLKENEILESKVFQIKEKYDALIEQQQNSLEKFVNNKEHEFNEYEKILTSKILEVTEIYNKKIEDLKKYYQEKIEALKLEIDDIFKQESTQKQKRAELKYKIFFKKEIEHIQTHINELKKEKQELETSRKSLSNDIKNYRKEWELEDEEITRKFDADISKKRQEIENKQIERKNISQKIEQSKSSFYSWLNNNVKGWESNIGKIINDETLYNQHLEAKIIENKNELFYGIEINLEILERNVKTVEELKLEIENINDEIIQIQKSIDRFEQIKESEINKLKTKYSKKINQLKDKISENEYNSQQKENKIRDLSLSLSELKEKSKSEKENELEKIEDELNRLAIEKQKRIQEKEQITNREKHNIKRLLKEKSEELNEIDILIKDKKIQIDKEKLQFKNNIQKNIEEYEKQKFSEMKTKGADTERITQIQAQIKDLENKLDFIERNKILVIEYNKDKRELFDKIPEFKAKIKVLETKKAELSEKNKKDRDKLVVKLKEISNELKLLELNLKEFEEDDDKFAEFKKSDVFISIEQYYVSSQTQVEGSKEKAISIIEKLKEKHYKTIDSKSEIRRTVNMFVGNFSEDNIFKFKTKFDSDEEYISFASDLKEFIEEDKIEEFEKRVNERFANIIHLIARETHELLSKEAEIETIIRKINKDFASKNFVKAINDMEIRINESSHPVVSILIQIKKFHDENNLIIGKTNLFTSATENGNENQKAANLIKQLIKEIAKHKNPVLRLSDSFDLQFRIVENDNDTGWVENLTNVGSEGTDILVKAMVNILLLNVFKESASRKFKDFKLHCMMDEIGRLHPVNVKGILRFANERNILLINGSPISQNAMDYRYTYKLSKEKSIANNKYITHIKKLVTVN